MHYSEINHEAEVAEPLFDLDEDRYGDRPYLLNGFTPVDSSDVIVPVDQNNPESFVLALTEKQAVQALLCLVEQIGDVRAIALINKQSAASK